VRGVVPGGLAADASWGRGVRRDPETIHAADRDTRALNARGNPDARRSSGTANACRAASTAKAVPATRQGRRRPGPEVHKVEPDMSAHCTRHNA